MNIPPKLMSGQNFRSATVRTINAIIDYLHASRIVADNRTIRTDRTPVGQVIRAIPPPAMPKNKTNGGGSADLRLCVPTVAPNGGAGAATVAEVTLSADGTWTATATTHAVTVPEMG